MSIENVRALTFDVFGTVVDWRGSVIRETEELAKRKGFEIDAATFADEWRAGYGAGMQQIREGKLPWMKIDAVHRRRLDELLAARGITALSEAEKEDFNRVWHRLDPWPDAVEGLTRLKRKYIIATLSNGNLSLLTNMAKYGGLPWDCILTSELAGHFKPDPESYLTATRLLDLEPGQVMMVAAHVYDLRGAQRVGLRAGFVRRPHEYGPNRKPDMEPDPSFDVAADDFVDLAEKLGA